jgi:spore photoproduct lyase
LVRILNSFDSIKIVLYREPDLKYRSAKIIIDRSKETHKEIIEFFDEDDLLGKIDDLKKSYRSKEVLILKEFMGRKFQKCPGSPKVICCNYYLLNTCFNCLFNCTYCFLNSYLNSFGIVQFINLDDLADIIESFCNEEDRILRVGTGEFTDSLMFDEVTSIAANLIEGTSSIKKLFLEFKTKSSKIDHLKNVKSKGNAVLAWSLNTQRNIDLYEEGTSNIYERINACAKAQSWGYYTALHFDPIIKYDNFIDEYFKVIEMMAERLIPSKIVWISLGCFRYSPGFKDIIKNTFTDEKLTLEEMFPGIDGKYRYITPERGEIYKRIKEKIQFHFPGVFIYLCMEDSDMWDRVFGKDYETSNDLENDLSRYLLKNFMK